MRMQIKRVQKATPWSAADRARHRKIREQMQRDKPTPAELMRDGVWLPLGVYFELKEAIHRLKQAREVAGLSLAAMAKRTGMDKAALSRLENGRQPNPTFGTLSRYAAALGKQVCISFRDR
jgi:DNA-binding XRE family transcriptional regulator